MATTGNCLLYYTPLTNPRLILIAWWHAPYSKQPSFMPGTKFGSCGMPKPAVRSSYPSHQHQQDLRRHHTANEDDEPPDSPPIIKNTSNLAALRKNFEVSKKASWLPLLWDSPGPHGPFMSRFAWFFLVHEASLHSLRPFCMGWCFPCKTSPGPEGPLLSPFTWFFHGSWHQFVCHEVPLHS